MPGRSRRVSTFGARMEDFERRGSGHYVQLNEWRVTPSALRSTLNVMEAQVDYWAHLATLPLPPGSEGKPLASLRETD